jgi:large subunit ribosomal protein L22
MMAQNKKPPTARIVAPTEARAKLRTLRISPQKLNLVAQSIRGCSVRRR